MGRDMAFWKYKDGVYLDHQKIYEQVCCEGEENDGLKILPISDIRRRLEQEFSDYEMLDDDSFEGSSGAFTVTTTDRSIRFDCTWELPPRELNRIIDVMSEFDLPFYDPQISVRFDEVTEKI